MTVELIEVNALHVIQQDFQTLPELLSGSKCSCRGWCCLCVATVSPLAKGERAKLDMLKVAV